MSLHLLTPGWIAPRPRSTLTCSTLQIIGWTSSLLHFVYTVWRPPTRFFRNNSNAWGRHSIVLPLIINAAIFSPLYSTILQSLAVGSLGLTMGGGDLAYCDLLCPPISILGYSGAPGLEKSLGEKPWGNPGSPGKPKLGGRDNIDAMLTIETPEGAREGGLEAGDRELSLSGDLDWGWGGDESLNWDRSVGAGGAGIEIIFVCSTPCNITIGTLLSLWHIGQTWPGGTHFCLIPLCEWGALTFLIFRYNSAMCVESIGLLSLSVSVIGMTNGDLGRTLCSVSLWCPHQTSVTAQHWCGARLWAGAPTHNPNPEREREELSYDFIPPSAQAGQGARSPSLSSPFRLRLWWSAASTVRFVYRSGPSARPAQTLHGGTLQTPLTVTVGDHF